MDHQGSSGIPNSLNRFLALSLPSFEGRRTEHAITKQTSEQM
jgi:hypothetical protein